MRTISVALDTLAQQTSCSRAEVLRRCLRGARLRSTVDAQALTEVSRVHANLNRIGGLLKLAIREGVSDRSSSHPTEPRAHRLGHGRPPGGESLGGAAVIVRHQRESASNRGFRHLARYIQGRDAKPRATWFHAANLPGVSGKDDLELACKLVEAVQAQNTRAGSKRTYHLVISLHPDDRRLERKELKQVVESLVDTLGFSEHQYIAVRHNDTDHEHIHVAINKIHPETFRIHSPAWDHQKLFTGARALERELGLTPLRSRTRDREKVPQRAADCEAHHGIDSFARWAREKLRPALRQPSYGAGTTCTTFAAVLAS